MRWQMANKGSGKKKGPWSQRGGGGGKGGKGGNKGKHGNKNKHMAIMGPPDVVYHDHHSGKPAFVPDPNAPPDAYGWWGNDGIWYSWQAVPQPMAPMPQPPQVDPPERGRKCNNCKDFEDKDAFFTVKTYGQNRTSDVWCWKCWPDKQRKKLIYDMANTLKQSMILLKDVKATNDAYEPYLDESEAETSHLKAEAANDPDFAKALLEMLEAGEDFATDLGYERKS